MKTASWVATAYTIRYGREKADRASSLTPVVMSGGLGEEVGRLVSVRTDSDGTSDGGSMKVDGCEEIASGSGGISSLWVSMVICVVGLGTARKL